MKTAHTASTRKTTAKPSSVLSQLWAAVHPKPALPIGHPIPRLTPPPVPTSRNALRSPARRRAAVDYLSRFLCVGFALALLVTGCVGPRPLKGGRAVTTRKPGGVVEQTLVQGENPSQASKQDQETVKVRSYTV